jgi:hypothetical protein
VLVEIFSRAEPEPEPTGREDLHRRGLLGNDRWVVAAVGDLPAKVADVQPTEQWPYAVAKAAASCGGG